MPEAPTFRPLVVADAEAFRRLRLAALERHPRFFGSTAAEEGVRDLAFFADRIRGRLPGDAVFGAFVDAELVGIAALRQEETASRRHRAMLQTVYVVPEHRGGTVAEGLVGAVIAHARRHVELVDALVAAENRRARAFYRRLGFVATGLYPKMLRSSDGWSDEVVLALDFAEVPAEGLADPSGARFPAREDPAMVAARPTRPAFPVRRRRSAMTTDPFFRPLDPEADAEAFRALRLEALGREPEFFGSTVAEEGAHDLDFFRDRLRARQPGNVVYGAFVGEVLVGLAGMYRGEGVTRRHRGVLWTVYVAPEHRGSGLAEGLLRALIAHARVHVDLLTGLVVADNHRARAFYRRLGFSISGVERKVLKFGDRYLDEEILVMDFTEEPAGA